MIGTVGGILLSNYNWLGLITMITTLLGVAFVLSASLVIFENPPETQLTGNSD